MALLNIFQNMNFDIQNNGNEVFVSNYWDDVNLQIRVYWSDNLITKPTSANEVLTGDDSDEGIPSYYYSPLKFCDGATLTKFQYSSVFPYAIKQNESDHASCIEVSTDLKIVDISYTKESTDGAADATITVNATGSNKPFQYSLGNTNYQNGNIFTGLTAGIYTVSVKDETATIENSQIEIPETQSYGHEYTFEFDIQQKSSSQVCKFKIYKLGYSGGVTEVDCGDSAPLFESFGQKGDNKYKPIKGKFTEFFPLSITDFQWEDFHSEQERDRKVEILIDDVVTWAGYGIPNLHEEPFFAPPYPVKLEFSDLAQLRDVKFEYYNGSKIKGNKSLSWIIKYCLDELGLGLDIHEGVNIFNENHSKVFTTYTRRAAAGFQEHYGTANILLSILSTDVTSEIQAGDEVFFENADYGEFFVKVISSDYVSANTEILIDYPYSIYNEAVSYVTKKEITGSPFTQTYVDAEIYSGLDCYEVLEAVLKGFGAQIQQINNVWVITQVNEKKANFELRKYDSNFVYQSSETISRALTIGNSNIRWANKSGVFTQLPGVKDVVINLKPGLKSNLVNGGDLLVTDFDSDGNPNNWRGNSITTKRSGPEDDIFAFSINGYTSALTNATYLEQDITPVEGSTSAGGIDYIEFSFKYNILSNGIITDANPVTIPFKVTAETFSRTDVTYIPYTAYLSGEDGFVTAETTVELEAEKFNEWKEYKVLISNPFARAKLNYRFYQIVHNGTHDIQEIRISQVKARFLPNGDQAPETITTIENNSSKYRNSEIIDLINADAPSTIDSSVSIYKGIFKDYDNLPTKLWARGSNSESLPLTSILANDVLFNNKRPSRVLTGQLLNETTSEITPDKIITEANISGGLFCVNSYRRNYKKSILDIELVENISDALPVINNARLREDGGYSLREDGCYMLRE